MSINHPGNQIAASHHLMAVQQWTSECALMVKANLLSCGKWYPCCKKAISEADFTHALHLLCRWDNAIMSWEGKRQHEALWPCAQQSCERGGKWEDSEENAPGLLEVSMHWLCLCHWMCVPGIHGLFHGKLECQTDCNCSRKKCQEKKRCILYVYIHIPPFSSTQSTVVYSVCVSFLFSGAGELL